MLLDSLSNRPIFHAEIYIRLNQIITLSPQGHNYDIIDIWNQPDTALDKLPLRSVPHEQQHDVHFTAFRESFHLRLRKNGWLIREGLRMETLGRNGLVVDSKEVQRDCHYFGEFVSHNSSSVALSKCDGLVRIPYQ